jgi:hypothetical protein
MKLLFTILALLFTNQAHAWTKIIDCNNGELVVDQGDTDAAGRPTYQLVLRGQPLDYFISTGAVTSDRVNDKAEFIVSVNTYDGNLLGTIGIEVGVQHLYWIIRNGQNVAIRAEIGGRPGTGEEVANWQFQNCR